MIMGFHCVRDQLLEFFSINDTTAVQVNLTKDFLRTGCQTKFYCCFIELSHCYGAAPMCVKSIKGCVKVLVGLDKLDKLNHASRHQDCIIRVSLPVFALLLGWLVLLLVHLVHLIECCLSSEVLLRLWLASRLAESQELFSVNLPAHIAIYETKDLLDVALEANTSGPVTKLSHTDLPIARNIEIFPRVFVVIQKLKNVLTKNASPFK
mmetsp:Transcript_114497/g.214421  ORF Transcript_114497/g.214421 Transcript_114497/m.214421 type:complete len:208 (-) Transcript_114497:514-1137(-)